ncbi:MAG: hypothetical protein LBS74_02990 [Oscillospiraceae bacterium]|jgi:hypothetical protein|nr:hypothetical protein [Oscillospiraceae bacterium]
MENINLSIHPEVAALIIKLLGHEAVIKGADANFFKNKLDKLESDIKNQIKDGAENA